MKKLSTILVLVLSLALAPAQAAMVGTERALGGDERARVKALIERPELARQLEQMGLPAHDAAARVDAMSEEEVRSLAGRLQAVPAGGDLSNTDLLLLILVILLIVLLI